MKKSKIIIIDFYWGFVRLCSYIYSMNPTISINVHTTLETVACCCAMVVMSFVYIKYMCKQCLYLSLLSPFAEKTYTKRRNLKNPDDVIGKHIDVSLSLTLQFGMSAVKMKWWHTRSKA